MVIGDGFLGRVISSRRGRRERRGCSFGERGEKSLFRSRKIIGVKRGIGGVRQINSNNSSLERIMMRLPPPRLTKYTCFDTIIYDANGACDRHCNLRISSKLKGEKEMRTAKVALCGIIIGFAAVVTHALEVSEVKVQQRWPWNNLVDISFRVTGTDAGEVYVADVRATYPGVAGDALKAKTLKGEPIFSGDDVHTVVWDMGADAPDLVTEELQVSVSVAPVAPETAVYMVVDLSEGAEAETYPVRYTLEAPDVSGDKCRTSELWLRRCMPGVFQMGYSCGETADSIPGHYVRLTKPFYIGVFEVTQEQWFRVMGNWPSFYANEAYRATRPVERVTLSDMRGKNYGWYNSPSTVSSSSFMGKMRSKAGLALADLPTEAQWEYAYRAGTTGQAYFTKVTGADFYVDARANTRNLRNKGGNSDDTNADTSSGTAKVGSYKPNPWGLYDMAGNVMEWCGDGNNMPRNDGWKHEAEFAAFTLDSPLVDPRIALPSVDGTYWSAWTGRGGGISEDWQWTNAQRRKQLWDGKEKGWGFRLCVTME